MTRSVAKPIWLSLSFVLAFGFSQISFAQTWNQFIEEVRNQALSEGIRPEVFDDAFANIHEPNRSVINLDKRQPEKRLTFLKYRKTRGDNYRILLGKREYKKHRAALEQTAAQFGVNPCYIVALWGMESSYGRFMGSFPVIKSLATLSYNNRRGEFFRKQLIYALHILNDGHVTLDRFKGEWAGASGHPQFLPSSWQRYAVDADGDGRKDIWGNLNDAFASIANYLAENGWQTGEPWGFAVKVPNEVASGWENSKQTKPLSEWQALGVVAIDQNDWPQQDLSAELIRPYGGPSFLVFKNFRVIMKYNRSTYYAGTIGHMADQICTVRNKMNRDHAAR